ncbi:unnamed protein product, partial [marine sediment metagenome]
HGAHEEQDYQVTLAETGLDTMTGARVKRIRNYISEDTFMVTYGDGISNVNIGDLLNFHHKHGRLATITTVRPISRFGILELNAGGQVESFAEKPQINGRVNAGFFVFNKKVFEYLSEEPDCVLESGPMQHLAHQGQLMAYQHDGFFYAMDTYREYSYLNDLWTSGNAPWVIWANQDGL